MKERERVGERERQTDREIERENSDSENDKEYDSDEIDNRRLHNSLLKLVGKLLFLRMW